MAKTDNPLSEKIKRLISLTGPISIDVYMEMCLYDDTYGYYKTQKPIGANGDFITAPEISQMFGEMCGIWLFVNWQKIGAPNHFKLIELGAGRGTLMLDMLRSFRALFKGVDCPAIEIAIIETNAHLKGLQNQILTGERVSWFGSMSDFSLAKETTGAQMPLFVIANEFFDCLPIKQFIKAENHWHEKQVGLGADGELVFGLGPPYSRMIGAKNDGPIHEYCAHLEPILGEIFGGIINSGGAALFIDYGYYKEYAGDTLQALHKHQKIPVLKHCGNADLTAHVDFGQIEKIARQIGINDLTIQTQCDFLLGFGIEARKNALCDKNPQMAQSLSQDLARLIGLDQMGELFKVFECSYSKD